MGKRALSFWGNKGCWMLMLTNQKSLNLISKGGLLKTTKSFCFKDPFLERVPAHWFASWKQWFIFRLGICSGSFLQSKMRPEINIKKLINTAITEETQVWLKWLHERKLQSKGARTRSTHSTQLHNFSSM